MKNLAMLTVMMILGSTSAQAAPSFQKIDRNDIRSLKAEDLQVSLRKEMEGRFRSLNNKGCSVLADSIQPGTYEVESIDFDAFHSFGSSGEPRFTVNLHLKDDKKSVVQCDWIASVQELKAAARADQILEIVQK